MAQTDYFKDLTPQTLDTGPLVDHYCLTHNGTEMGLFSEEDVFHYVRTALSTHVNDLGLALSMLAKEGVTSRTIAVPKDPSQVIRSMQRQHQASQQLDVVIKETLIPSIEDQDAQKQVAQYYASNVSKGNFGCRLAFGRMVQSLVHTKG